MATTKTKKVSIQRPTTAETAVRKMADFVSEVIAGLGVELGNGKITKKTYEASLRKLDEVTKQSKDLLDEVIYLEGFIDELDAESKKKVQDVKDYYEELIDELEKEYQENVEKAYQTGATNVESIYKAFNTTCDQMKEKLDEKHLLGQVQELKKQLQDQTARADIAERRANQAETDAEYAQGVAYDEFLARKSFEEQYNELKKQHATLENQIHTLQVNSQLKARKAVKTDDSYARAQQRILVLQRELALVNDRIKDIKRNLIQSFLCDEFGVPENTRVGIPRAKALAKAQKKAIHNKTYTQKLDNVANRLKEEYSDWFVDAPESDKDYTVRKDVESTLKTTIYKIPTILKSGAILMLAGLVVVSGLFVGKTKVSAIKEGQLNDTIASQGETITSQDEANKDLNNRLEGQKNANKDLEEKNNQLKDDKSQLKEDLDNTKKENDQLKENLDNTKKENDQLKEDLANKEIKEKQDFALTGDKITSKVTSLIQRRAKGTVQNVSFSYNALTGDIAMVAFVEKEGKTTLVVGQGTINTGCKLDENSVQQYISDMAVKAYNFKDVNTGIYYRVTNVKSSMTKTCQVEGCKVEIAEDGTIASIATSSYTKTGKEVDQNAVINQVLGDLLTEQVEQVNE